MSSPRCSYNGVEWDANPIPEVTIPSTSCCAAKCGDHFLQEAFRGVLGCPLLRNGRFTSKRSEHVRKHLPTSRYRSATGLEYFGLADNPGFIALQSAYECQNSAVYRTQDRLAIEFVLNQAS